MYFLDEYTSWFAHFEYKPLFYIYAALALGMLVYAFIRAITQRVKVNKHRKKLENVIAEKFKNEETNR